MPQNKEQRQTHPTVRRVITLAELAVTMVLLWLPTLRLVYDELLSTEVAASFFLQDTVWEMPMQVLQVLFAAALVAAIVPLFVRQVDRFWTMLALTAVAGVSFLSHVALYIGWLFTVGEHTYYGLTPQLTLTTAGQLYVVLAVFSLIEAVCTCVSIRREAAEESEVPTDEQAERDE